jgi:hypothetical protein
MQRNFVLKEPQHLKSLNNYLKELELELQYQQKRWTI